MRKIILFFTGLAILLICGGSLFLAGAILDTGNKIAVETYFFQPNNLSSGRPGVPVLPNDLGEDRVTRMLIDKFVTEYFYAIPDEANIIARMNGATVLPYIASGNVFKAWRAGEAQKIQQLARDKSMRTARVVGEILKPMGSDYWTVEYELKTWENPNDMSEIPVITRGRMYVNISYVPGLREPVSYVHEYLEAGNDPAAVFIFKVNAIAME